MFSLVNTIAPEPIAQMAKEVYRFAKAESKKCSDPTTREAGKVIGIAAVRIMLVVALYYGIHKVGADPKVTSGVGAIVSLPVTALYWGVRGAIDYGKKAYESFLARNYQQVAVNGALAVGSYAMMNSHNCSLPLFGRFGAIEWGLQWTFQSHTIEIYKDRSGTIIPGY